MRASRLFTYLDNLAAVSFAVLGSVALASMIFVWHYQGSPFLPVPLFPTYSPHGYKIVEWTVAYFLFFRPRYGLRAFPMFLFSYGSLEVLFNVSYLVMHPSLRFGDFPLFDAQYPLRLSFYFLVFVIGILLAKPRIKFPKRMFKRGIIVVFLIENAIGYLTGYSASSPDILRDFIGNTLFILIIWAVVYTEGPRVPAVTADKNLFPDDR